MPEAAVYTRRGASRARDEARAVAELHDQIVLSDMELGVFFCSPDYDLEALESALRETFGDVPLIGCTSSGEVGPGGYAHGSIVGASLSSAYGTAQTAVFNDLANFEMSDGADIAMRLLHDLRAKGVEPTPLNTFVMLLIDGLGAREEIVSSAVHLNLHGVPMFGGSAGDEDRLKETLVYADGEFRSNRFALAAFHTEHPFAVFRHQHFEPAGEALVVTAADTPRRIIHELNGRPAAEEYARVLGRDLKPDDPRQFTLDPMMVKVGGEYYLRSPMENLPDGSLRFACAIAVGLVFMPGKSLGLVPSLERQAGWIRSQVGPPELMIACDCLGRLAEAEQLEQVDQVGSLLDDMQAVGLATYGEQINSMHVNQTLTGVALGRQDGAG